MLSRIYHCLQEDKQGSLSCLASITAATKVRPVAALVDHFLVATSCLANSLGPILVAISCLAKSPGAISC